VQNPSKFTQIWIFGLKIYHLASLETSVTSEAHNASLDDVEIRVARSFVTTYQNGKKYTRRPQNTPNSHNISIPNGCRIFQMAIKHNNTFHSKGLKNIPKMGFLF
jgi:hypothetical protein